MRRPSARTSLRTVFFCTSPNRLLLTRALRRAASRSLADSAASPFAARTAVAIPSPSASMRPGRSFANQSSRLAVASASGRARWLAVQLDAEEVRQRAELVVLEVRIPLAGDDERVQVGARLDARAVAEGLLEERDVEADRMADERGLADEVERLARGLGGARRALDVLVGDAVHLVADDRAPGVDEGRPAVGDLAALDPDRRDLDEVGHLRVGARGLDVDDDELAARLRQLGELEHGVGEGLEVRQALRLADELAELLLQLDERRPATGARRGWPRP